MTLDPKTFKDLARFLAPSAGGEVADRALQEGIITPEQHAGVLREQRESGRPLDEILVDRGFVKSEDVTRFRRPPLPPEVIPYVKDPARRFGHYVATEVAGRGGMSEVWKAWDLSLNRWVAVKLLRPELGESTRRIEREGHLAGVLSHPNIVSIFERGRHDGRAYLVMPFVEGKSPIGPLSPREAARVAREAARALAHAHERGVVHRDVKPGNILVEPNGRVVLTDFGLAMPGDTGGSQWTFYGTPAYAAPEQIRGEPADVRADVYSLGATLHHFLSGRPPFEGGEPESVSERVLRGETRPLPRTPRALAAIVEKSMAADPARRYPSVEAMALDLDRFLDEGGSPRSLLKPRSLAAIVLAGLLSSGTTYFIVSRTMVRSVVEARRLELEAGHDALARAERARLAGKGNSSETRETLQQAIWSFLRAIETGAEEDARLGLGRCYELVGRDEWAGDQYAKAARAMDGRLGMARISSRRRLEGRDDPQERERVRQMVEGLDDPAAAALRAFADDRWKDVLAEGAAAPIPGRTVLLAMGVAAVEIGRWDEAVKWLGKSARLHPADPAVWYQRARAFAGKGNAAESRRSASRALAFAPKDWPLRPEADRLAKRSTSEKP